ncbi:MAG: flagellar biosynthetic protein FliQ [Deltaproteobacteria bacterium]
MTVDSAIELALAFLRVTLYLTAPVLAASIIAGVLVGVLQTATQVNEASVSYVAKVIAVLVVLVALGPALAAHAVAYTRSSLEALARVGR